MIPLRIVHEHLLALNIRHLNNTLKHDPNLATFPKRPINPPLLTLIPLNRHLLAYKLLNIQKLLTEQVLHNNSVVIMKSVNDSSLVFLFV